MLIVFIFSLSLCDAESLALKNAPELVTMEENLEAMNAEYRALLFSFSPSLYVKGNAPSVNYYSDDIYYPGSPYPIPYWQRYESRGGEVGFSSSLPFGGEGSISYSLYKNEEYYNLYENREYYEGRLNFSLSQPILGVSQSWDGIKEKKREIQDYRLSIMQKKREIIKNVIRNYVNLWVLKTERNLIRKISSSAQFSQEKLDFLYKNNLMDKVEYLRVKQKYGLLIVEGMNLDSRLNEAIFTLKSLTGLDSIDVSEPEIPEIAGSPVPDDYFALCHLESEKKSLLRQKSELLRNLLPSLDISLSLGLRGKGDMEEAKILKKNTYNINLSLNLPIFSPPNYLHISGINHRIDGINKRIEATQKKVAFKKLEMVKKTEIERKKIKILKGSLNASEQILKSKNLDYLPFHERLDVINDYINAIKSFAETLKEFLELSTEFVNAEGK